MQHVPITVTSIPAPNVITQHLTPLLISNIKAKTNSPIKLYSTIPSDTNTTT